MDHESNSTVSGKGVFKREIFIYYNACLTSVELVSVFTVWVCSISRYIRITVSFL